MAKPDIVISAHLLEGHSADETNPYVQGDYETHEKLTRLVRYRCCKILRSILSETEIPDVGRIIVQARHGVRQSYYGMPSGSGRDIAMTIYEVSITIDSVRDEYWLTVKNEEIMTIWKVEKNIITSLQFETVWF